MIIKILEKSKKKGGKYYVVVGKEEGSPFTLLFGRFKKLSDAKQRVEELAKIYG